MIEFFLFFQENMGVDSIGNQGVDGSMSSSNIDILILGISGISILIIRQDVNGEVQEIRII